MGGCLGLAALSLLGPAQPTYDPWAWLIWGREIGEGTLTTTDGPSWKPLPVLFTTPFALLGDDVAPALWLVVARAGGLLAVAMAFRLAARLAGTAAGVVAGVALLLADEFVRNFARGNSEGLLVALVLLAVERHLDDRRTHAFLIGVAAGLLRPEIWPFLGLYGLWLAWRRPERRLLVGGCFALLGGLWFIPEWLGSGDPLRASERARQPNPDSAAFAAHPFLEVFGRSSTILAVPVLAGAAVCLVVAGLRWWRSRRAAAATDPELPAARVELALGAVATVLMVTVAAMTQAGYAGNLRYVALPAALVAVLAGVGWVELLRGARTRFGALPAAVATVALLALSAPFAVLSSRALVQDVLKVRSEANFNDQLPIAIANAGGADRVRRCGTPFTGNFQVPVVAWYLHVHGTDVKLTPDGTGVILASRYSGLSRDERYAKLTETTKWIVRAACRV